MNSVYTCRVQIPDKNLETLPKEGPRNRNHGGPEADCYSNSQALALGGRNVA